MVSTIRGRLYILPTVSHARISLGVEPNHNRESLRQSAPHEAKMNVPRIIVAADEYTLPYSEIDAS